MGKLTKQRQLFWLKRSGPAQQNHALKKVGNALCRSREIIHGDCCFEHFHKRLFFFFKKGRRRKIIHCLVPDHWFLSCLRRAGHELGTVCWAPFVGTRTNETLICIRTIYQWAHSSFFSSWSLSCPTFSGCCSGWSWTIFLPLAITYFTAFNMMLEIFCITKGLLWMQDQS